MNKLLTGIFMIVLITISSLALLAAPKATAQNETWPWGTASEPYPWLEYLKSLPHDTNITLIIITRHEATITEKVRTEFLNSPVAKQLGIDNIRFVSAGPELWESYIQRSIESGTPIDVAWGGGPTLFNYIDEKGFLQSINPEINTAYYAVLYEMSKIPTEIAGVSTIKYGPDGSVHWIGAAISSFGFTINHQIINDLNLPVPQTWTDLTKPEYAKLLPDTPLIGIADPTMSTSNTRMYEIILQAYGWDQGWRILTLMAANSKIFDSSSGVRDAVIRNEIAAGITIDFYGYTAMHQNPNCEYILPQGATIINADPIAIINGTKHPVQAAAFVAWVLSQYGGQQIWLDPDINRLPINPEVFNTSAGQERTDLEQAYELATTSPGIDFNDTLALLTERAMQFYFKATLVNAHDDLQAVWAHIAKAYLDGKINDAEFEYLVQKLTDPITFTDPVTGEEVTFTQEYAIQINDKLSDPQIYQSLMTQWEENARERYLNAYNLLDQILSGELTITTGQQGEETGTITGTQGETQTTTEGGSLGSTLTSNITLIIGIIIIVAAAYFILKR